MDSADVAVIEKKYAEKQIRELQQSELNAKTADAILRIHVITGWNIPDDKNYSRILHEELTQKLKEGFPMLNFQEVVYAFRKNGLGIKDWGKNMNIDLICEVLSQYTTERERISFDEERLKDKPVQIIYTPEELLNIQRADVEAFYQRCLNRIIPPNELPGYFKDILVHDKFISEDSNDLHAFFAWHINNGSKNIYLKG